MKKEREELVPKDLLDVLLDADNTEPVAFIDEDGRAVEIRRMTLLLRTQKPAKVKYVHDYFQLMEKGILVVKEI